MVEGPGCTRNGRKSQTLVGKTVVASEPNASEGMKCVPNDVAQTLAGQTLESVFTVGKELYMVLRESIDGAEYENALRLHFGMNGSLNIRKADNKSSGVAPWKQNKQVSLRLYFSDNKSRITILEAWDTNVSTRVSAEASRNKLCNLACKDACSTMFNAQEVFVSLRRDGHNLSVSDALLHQEIFPGVGNIIKVESLHRSQIDPRRIVGDISDVELRRLIRHARKFSMDWLNTGRAGTKLVYNQTVCGTCNGMTVKMQKIGGGNEDGGSAKGLMSRVTFWCVTCQPSAVNSSKTTHNMPQSMASVVNNENTTQQSFHSAPTVVVPSIPAVHQPQCPQHGTRSIKLCRTRNSTKQNNLRLFFTCKSRGCNYFFWADSNFPNCKCGAKAVLRVSKTEKSGGRWFLCCARTDRKSGNTDGCGHFEWAKPEYIASLGQHLSPLL